jgi:phosphoribosyl-AMP cyclohydrolase
MSDSARETGTTLDVKFNADGLVPAIVQDAETGDILMMAWMNEQAIQHTLECGNATFYSRSRQKMWVKGESSGHTQKVVDMRIDCDQDTILMRVKSSGPACHVGYKTCFYRSLTSPTELKIVEEKAFDPDKVYNK